KESEADYRHMPDPDLAPVDVAALARARPAVEPPFARRARLAKLAGAGEADVAPLLEERALADACELAAARAGAATALPFFVRDVRAELEWRKVSFAASGLEPDALARLAEALRDKRVTPQVATRVLRGQASLDEELAGGGADVAAA